ncbi:PKD domain-containing protein [Haladaptatus sp. NG-SE-30]
MSRRAVLTALLVVSLVGTAVALPPPGLPGDDLPDAPASDHDTYAIQQGGTCVPVKPIRGNQNVVEFYDYRNPYTEPSDWSYSSFAPSSVTRDNGSTMFLYEAPNGVVSLVILHDQRRSERIGDGLPMSAVTFRFGGLPGSGQWVLMDDTYENRDDRWSRNRIDWTWTGSRVDGAVFRGLSGEFRMTVVPRWNEDAALHDTRFESESVNSWTFLSGSVGNPSETQLDMGTPLVVTPDGCGAPPEAALSATGSDEGDETDGSEAKTGEPVSFDAGETTDPDDDVTEYRWDFDGDGTVDETTKNPTIEHVFESPGEYSARVTVVDSEGHTDAATATVRVSRPIPDISVASASLDQPQVSPGETVTVTATLENVGDGDGTAIVELSVEETAVESKQVDVPAGASREVTFTYRAESPGEHAVRVSGVEGEAGTVEAGTLVVERSTTTESPGDGTGDSETGDDEKTGDETKSDSNALPGLDVLAAHPKWGTIAVGLALLAGAIAARR